MMAASGSAINWGNAAEWMGALAGLGALVLSAIAIAGSKAANRRTDMLNEQVAKIAASLSGEGLHPVWAVTHVKDGVAEALYRLTNEGTADAVALKLTGSGILAERSTGPLSPGCDRQFQVRLTGERPTRVTISAIGWVPMVIELPIGRGETVQAVPTQAL